MAIRLATVAAVVGGLVVLVAAPASAGVGLGATPTFPSPVTVGQTGLPASLQIVNTATPPDNLNPVVLSTITLVPACGTPFPVGLGDCPAAMADPGVFALSPTAVGEAGTACAGTTFTVTLVDAPTGKVRFTPSTAVTLQPPGSANATCRIAFTFNVLKTPAKDSQPSPGIQTSQLAFASGTNTTTTNTGSGSGSSNITVLAASPAVVTSATPATLRLGGGTASDSASLSGGAGPAGPTGSISFRLYSDATCTTPVFSPAPVAVNGNGIYVSPPFTPTGVGTFRWVASYSGDANNNPFVSVCGDPGETFTVTQAIPNLVTTASGPPASLPGTVSDTATVSNGFSPTGTITFRLFAPSDPTCAGVPVFTSAPVSVAGNGNYPSGPATLTTAGTYRWTATYSGDANNLAVFSPCGSANEQVTVLANPVITTVATPSTAAIGSPVHDTATLSNGTTPTGTIVFRLFGPFDATCSATPAFTSAPAPVAGNGSYSSPNFTPMQVGTYLWTAAYSGDALNRPFSTVCGAPNETLTVPAATPALVTTASGPVPLGGAIHDTAVLAGGATPTGTITFDLYGPDNATCAGPPAFTATVPVAGNGNYDSPNFTANQAGVYRWVASYSGDARNNPVGPTACNDPAESVVVRRTVVGDYNGDGRTDVAVFRPSNGGWYIQGQGGTVWGTAGDIAVPGDYNGDGRTDIAVFRPSAGAWYILGQPGSLFGTGGDIPVPADYNGDGRADIAVFRPSNGGWYIQGQGGAFWGTAGDIPVPGDYNGDGRADIAVYRPSEGVWYIQGQGPGQLFGAPGDIPVPGDYNGDGRTDIAVYRPSAGGWYIQGQPGTVFGAAGDIPVPGDYNGDGRTDIAVYRPSAGGWYIKGQVGTVWGGSGDQPLPLPAAIRQAIP